MKKLLFWGDSPCSSTGFSRVANHILKSLQSTGEYDITVVAINHSLLYYSQKEFPYKIYPALFADGNDPFGVGIMQTMLETQEWDVLIGLNDPDILYSLKPYIEKQREKNKDFKAVFYVTIDSPIPVLTHRDAASICDKMVFCSEFAEKMVLENFPEEAKGKTSIIPYGTDIDVYKKIPERERIMVREKAFEIQSDKTFLVLTVNRNQWRKDFFRTIWGFLLFWQKHPDSKLYMHCKIKDVGGDLVQMIGAICIWLKIDYKAVMNGIIVLHGKFDEFHGVPEERLNQIYNAADVFVSTSVGEGWGLPVTEAMAAETPVVVPNNSSLTDIVGENRGYLVKNGSNSNDWFMAYGFSTIPRPIVDIDDFVKQLEFVYNNRDDAKLRGHRGRKWCKERTWEVVGNMWIKLMREL